MATTKFNCCTCPEPPGYDPAVDDPLSKYRNKCGCPSAKLSCVSSEINAQICGFKKYNSDEVPTRRFLKVVSDWGNNPTIKTFGESSDCAGKTYQIDEITGFPFEHILTGNPCEYQALSSRPPSERVVTVYDCNPDGSTSFSHENTFFASVFISNNTEDFIGSISPGDMINTVRTETTIDADVIGHSFTIHIELITDEPNYEDTEDDALERADPAVEGNSCSSRYELRTTSTQFTKRTATYDVTATNLCPGRAYEGCVRIRKRKAYSGTVPDDPDTGTTEVIEWEDVEPDTITSFVPSAANTGEAVGLADGETEVALEVALPHEQGWEYEAVSAHIWPVSAGCDCPTDYVAPEEPAP